MRWESSWQICQWDASCPTFTPIIQSEQQEPPYKLSKHAFSPVDIMAENGHKSVSSLAIYQHTSDKPEEMSAALAQTLMGNQLK
jgi:hypothetical protein